MFWNSLFNKARKRKMTLAEQYEFYKNLDEKEYPKYLKEIYKEKIGKNLNLKNPKTYNEKIQWLKLYDNSGLRTMLTDKVKVRDWVKEKIFQKYLKTVYGIYNSFDDIEFDKLPESFVIKANHGSKMNYIITDKRKFLQQGAKKLRRVFDSWLKRNFAFVAGFELQYKDIEPKIIIEELLLDEMNYGCNYVEYQFLCSKGKPFLVNTVAMGSRAGYAYYSLDWEIQPFQNESRVKAVRLEKPQNFEEMIEITKKLCDEFKFVRVDLAQVNNKIYFSELTFTPLSGLVKFIPEKYDEILGKKIDLS